MKKLCATIIILLIAAALATAVAAAPPAWAGGKKKTSVIPTTDTASEKTLLPGKNTTSAQQAVAGTTPPATTNASAEGGLRAVDWGAISVAIAIVGALIGWFISRRTRSKSVSYMKEIDAAYGKYRTGPEKLEHALTELRERIVKDFEKGMLTDQSMALLEGRIDRHLKGARVDAVSAFRLPKDIKRQIKGMLDDGIITEEEYGRFTDMDLAHLSQKEYERLTRLMRKWKQQK